MKIIPANLLAGSYHNDRVESQASPKLVCDDELIELLLYKIDRDSQVAAEAEYFFCFANSRHIQKRFFLNGKRRRRRKKCFLPADRADKLLRCPCQVYCSRIYALSYFQIIEIRHRLLCLGVKDLAEFNCAGKL